MAQSKRVGDEQLLKANLIAVLCVCFLFAVIELIAQKVIASVCIVSMGFLLAVIFYSLKKRVPVSIQAGVLALGETTIILVVSTLMGSVLDMFALVLASSIMAGIYFNQKVIVVQAIYTNIVLLVIALFFFSTAFPEVGIGELIKAWFSMDVGMCFVSLLVKWGKGFIDNAQEKALEAEELVKTVNKQMEESEGLAQEQRNILNRVKESADDVADTSKEVTSITSRLNAGIVQQGEVIKELTQTLEGFSEHIQSTADAARNAKELSRETGEKMSFGSSEMERMLAAMEEITQATDKIAYVIKSIDDLAFQTNILAINASIEAARAGEFGKGFSVVATEVRDLANKSASSAKSTAALVEGAIAAAKKGAQIASEAGETFTSLSESEERSRVTMEGIVKMTEKQTASLSLLQNDIVSISQIVQQNNSTSHENDNISVHLGNQAAILQKIAASGQ